MSGVLAGLRIVELAGIGPAPFAATMLADHGAEVIRIERPGAWVTPADCLLRNRLSIALDLKKPGAIDVVRDLCRVSHGLIEGFRPGAMERMGLGPDVLLEDNPGLVYGRVTGWGQFGPLAVAAGHDINFIAITGLLHTVGERGQKPTVPVNYAGDFGGGGMMLAFGMVSALLHVRMGGTGQVIDCAMTDGSAMLMGMTWSLLNAGLWHDERGANTLDGGAHFYGTYECSDGKSVALGSVEPQFYAMLREKAGLDGAEFDTQRDASRWPELKEKVAAIFRTKSRDEWCDLLEGTDVCFAPVLSLAEAPYHPHNLARNTYIEVEGKMQPAPVPRFAASAPDPVRPPQAPGASTALVLEQLGYSPTKIATLATDGVVTL